MKNILLIILLSLIVSCSKTKTVLICGDHVCINKQEAKQYFEDNLSLEVKIVDKKEKNKIDLVELNIRSSEKNIRSVSITEKINTNKEIKVLSNAEIKKKKIELENRERIAKLKKKKTKEEKIKIKQDSNDTKIKQTKSINVIRTNKDSQRQIVDVCLILEKCNIEEISNYLIKQGKKKGFPDITLRE